MPFCMFVHTGKFCLLNVYVLIIQLNYVQINLKELLNIFSVNYYLNVWFKILIIGQVWGKSIYIAIFVLSP